MGQIKQDNGDTAKMLDTYRYLVNMKVDKNAHVVHWQVTFGTSIYSSSISTNTVQGYWLLWAKASPSMQWASEYIIDLCQSVTALQSKFLSKLFFLITEYAVFHSRYFDFNRQVKAALLYSTFQIQEIQKCFTSKANL